MHNFAQLRECERMFSILFSYSYFNRYWVGAVGVLLFVCLFFGGRGSKVRKREGVRLCEYMWIRKDSIV